ncbi:uncharacterized protein RSE6_14699 [Rhynchosporium secalis]|uniref:RING-type domain-containing protein n=1 Tax=Rhynchosporium secalis TaxID=38038 RepID=A0A1E1MW06_RHYSE|nr:uncharacterized protein RSE6_14699 [Rhynchosporium secalis]
MQGPGLVIFFAIGAVIAGLVFLSGIISLVQSRRLRRQQAWIERYGPRPAISGRPRQTRAKGLALAVLENIPIVKFGSRPKYPDSSLKDVELEEGYANDDWETATIADNSKDALAKEISVASVVETIQDLKMVAERVLSNEEECSICISDFVDDEEIRLLPCSHRFHRACIDPWLLNVSGTCPICRYDLETNAPTTPLTVQLPPQSYFRSELSPIPYIRAQAMHQIAMHARVESSNQSPVPLIILLPAIVHGDMRSVGA